MSSFGNIGSGGGSSSSIDKELVNTTYIVKNAFAGASVSDIIIKTEVFDLSSTPNLTDTIWRNQTTGLDLSSAPSVLNLDLVGSNALTDAELRASSLNTNALTDTQLRASSIATSELLPRSSTN